MLGTKACAASPVPRNRFKKHILAPLVLSAERYDAILDRCLDRRRDQTAAAAEERRYRKYLKEGSDALCKRFGWDKDDAESKQREALRKAERAAQQLARGNERMRKERLLEAQQILNNLKLGQLRKGLVESDVIYQRKYNEKVNREIAEDARRQQQLEKLRCPELLIPFANVTKEQLRAEQREKALKRRAEIRKDLEESRQRKLAEREQKIYEGILDREQYKCLQLKDEEAARELKAKNREFCRRAYQDAVKEKAQMKKLQDIFDRNDDRGICVDVARRRYLDRHYNESFKAMETRDMPIRDAWAQELSQLEQATKQRAQDLQQKQLATYQAEVQMDKASRRCQIEDLSRQRRAYEQQAKRQADQRHQRDKEIRRFQVAERLKNEETNKRFYASQKRLKDKATAELKSILEGQLIECVERRQKEQIRRLPCQEDPYLQQDIQLYDEALKVISKAQQEGRPTDPIIKAVENYRRKNSIDLASEGRMVNRRKLRDYCWPGYFSKADTAYRQYEQREKCRQEQENDRHRMHMQSIKINKIGFEARPTNPCVVECPIMYYEDKVCAKDGLQTCKQNLQSIKPMTPALRNALSPGSNKEPVPSTFTSVHGTPQVQSKPIKKPCKAGRNLTTQVLSSSLIPQTTSVLYSSSCQAGLSNKVPGKTQRKPSKPSNQNPIWR